MERSPPRIKGLLRKEVGFGCPVVNCGNPYLWYHHFDPPWHVEKHNRPEGMIALCILHANQADAGAFTKDQLRELKRLGADNVRGRFEWMRSDLLAVVGGDLYYRTRTPLMINGERVIWFDRDEHGRLLLSCAMPTRSEEPRLRMQRNDWVVVGDPTDVVCPPSGRLLRAKYANGDSISIEFRNLESAKEAVRRYPQLLGNPHDVTGPDWLQSMPEEQLAAVPARIAESLFQARELQERIAGTSNLDLAAVAFPVTLLEIRLDIGGSPYGLTPHGATFPGFTDGGNFFHRAEVGAQMSM